MSRKFCSRVGAVALALLLMTGSVADGQQLPGILGGEAETTEAPPDPAADEAQLRRLIETLEDPAGREELLANLRALLAAQGEQPSAPEDAPEDAFATAVDLVSERADLVRTVAVSVVAYGTTQAPLRQRYAAREDTGAEQPATR